MIPQTVAATIAHTSCVMFREGEGEGQGQGQEIGVRESVCVAATLVKNDVSDSDNFSVGSGFSSG
jgi:hypothetical protein